MQDTITRTYSAYGCMFKPGQVAPVGEAFREFKKIAGEEFFTLYNTNGVQDHHASLKGKKLYMYMILKRKTILNKKVL